MEESGITDMEHEATKFFVSNVTLKIAKVGMQRTVSAWNHHFIPGSVKLQFYIFLALFIVGLSYFHPPLSFF